MDLNVLLTKALNPNSEGTLKSPARMETLSPPDVIGNVNANFMSLIVFLLN
jgi:hypothetical protein